LKIKGYLSGGMRKIKYYNFPLFFAETKRLRGLGYDMYNPAERDIKDGFDPKKDRPGKLGTYLKVDFPAICASHFIAVLPGWEDSEGATKEVTVARWCDIPVIPVGELKSRADTLMGAVETLRDYEESILDTAKRIVNKDRNKSYGHPSVDFGRVAGQLTALGFRVRDPRADLDDNTAMTRDISAKDIPIIQICVKLSRQMNHYNPDSLVDIAGYAATAEKVGDVNTPF